MSTEKKKRKDNVSTEKMKKNHNPVSTAKKKKREHWRLTYMHLPPSLHHFPAPPLACPGEEGLKHLFQRGTHRRFGYSTLAVLFVYYFIGE